MTPEWTKTADRLPARGQRIDWISPGGDEVFGGTYSGVWLLPGGVYVYYAPILWRPAAEVVRG